MKILEINTVCGIRSTGRICTDLADLLKAEGHGCLIAYGREEMPQKYKNIAYRICSDRDVKLHALKSRIFDSAGFGSRRATEKLVRKIREYDPDVIHLHNLHGYYLDVETLFRFLAEADKPVVWTLHDCWAFTGHCAYFTSAGCERWKDSCHNCPLKKAYPSSLLFDRSKQNWQKKRELFGSVKNMTLVTPSEWLAGLVRESFLNKYDVRAIPNGVDLQVFRPKGSDFREKHGLSGKKIVLGVATSWSDRKGLPEFCKLGGLLGDDYKVVLVGLSQCQIKELPDTVLGLPVTRTAEELAEIYTAADVFVNAGREETMGLTTVEAMGCGTPAVVSNLTAVPEVVTPEGGIVLRELSAEGIASGVKEALRTSFDTRKNAERYEKNQQYFKYLKLYKEMTGAKN